MRCKNCGFDNEEGRYICENCGSPLYDEDNEINPETITATPKSYPMFRSLTKSISPRLKKAPRLMKTMRMKKRKTNAISLL